MRRFFLAVLLTGLLQIDAAAQEKADAGVRLLYSAKNVAAGDLHAILEKHYDGVATVKFVVEKQAGVISIRAANQGALDDVLKTIATLDKTPRSIAFQGVVIDAAAPAEGAAAVELDQAQLTGSAEAVLKVARGWVKEGKVARVRTFKWTGLENQVSEDTIGEIVPRASGMFSSSRGQFPSYSDTSVGTLFSVAPKITEANEIVCALIYNHSELDAKADEKKPEGGVAAPSRIVQGRAQTTVNIPSGRSVVISAREAGPSATASLVVLSAVITNPGAAQPVVASPVTPPATPPAVAARRTPMPFLGSSSSASALLSQFRTEEFARAVKLTDEQKRKLEELLAEYDKLMTEMRDKMQNRDAASVDELNALSTKRRAVDERAFGVLTDEQRNGFDKFYDQYRQASRSRLEELRGTGRLEPGVFGGSGVPRDRLSSINRSLERSPNEPRYLLMRGQIYAADEKWDEAIADYRKVMEVDPRNLAAIMDLAAILALRGDEPGYRQFAEQMLERFGHEGSAAEKLRVADACLLRPEWLPNAAAAESMLEKAIEGMPAEGPPAREGLRIDLGAVAGGVGPGGGIGGFSSSSSIAQEIVAARGRLHVLRSQPDEAIKVLKPMLDEADGRRLRPDMAVSGWCSMAIAHLSKGDKEAATSAINRARLTRTSSSGPSGFSSSMLTFELTSKVRLARTEQILGEAGVKPAAAK